jgi:hypothetical protein
MFTPRRASARHGRRAQLAVDLFTLLVFLIWRLAEHCGRIEIVHMLRDLGMEILGK